MTTELRLATRRSPLALAQTHGVARALRAAHGERIEVTLVEIDSTGDLDRTSAVAALTEMGAFVRSVQAAVLDGRADAAVHSLKDLPTAGVDGLAEVAFPDRADPRDAMVGSTLAALGAGSLVGTGSPRRIAQLLAVRPDLCTSELRGNVDTRLGKVRRGEVDAAVLAVAGLARLGRDDAIAETLDIDVMVPAPGQGVVVVEADPEGPAAGLLGSIDDPGVRAVAEVERRLLEETGAGCRSALGAIAHHSGGEFRLDAFVSDEDGARRATVTAGSGPEVVTAARRELGL